jgi:hypothetical protein
MARERVKVDLSAEVMKIKPSDRSDHNAQCWNRVARPSMLGLSDQWMRQFKMLTNPYADAADMARIVYMVACSALELLI